MIVVLGDDDMSEQPGTAAAARNRMVGRRRRNDRVARTARQLLTDMADYLEPAGHVIERLGDVVTDPAQSTAAARAGARRSMHQVFAR